MIITFVRVQKEDIYNDQEKTQRYINQNPNNHHNMKHEFIWRHIL